MKKMRFLTWILVCAIFFQSLMPAFTLTANAAAAGADSELTFNGGYDKTRCGRTGIGRAYHAIFRCSQNTLGQ